MHMHAYSYSELPPKLKQFMHENNIDDTSFKGV